MSDTLPPISAFDRDFLAAAGRYALELGRRPNGSRNFGVWDGGRRMLGEKTAGARPDLKVIIGKQETE